MGVQVGSLMVTNVPLWYRMLLVGEAVRVGAAVIWEPSLISAQFCCEPEIALKNKVY